MRCATPRRSIHAARFEGGSASIQPMKTFHALPWILLLLGLSLARAETLTRVADRDASVASSGGILVGDELVVGFPNFVEGPLETRTLLHFALPDWLASKTIEHATLRLYYFDAWVTFAAARVRAFEILAPWAEPFPRFDIDRGQELDVESVGNRDFGWREWEIRPELCAAWARTPSANHGVLLAYADGSTATALRFRGRESADASLLPNLQIQYRDRMPPTIVETPEDIVATAGETATARVVVQGDGLLSVEWRRDGVLRHRDTSETPLPSGTQAVYLFHLPQVGPADEGQYEVVLRDDSGGEARAAFSLTLASGGLPPSLLWTAAHELANRHYDPPHVIRDASGDAITAARFWDPTSSQQEGGIRLWKVDRTGSLHPAFKQWEYSDPHRRVLHVQSLVADRVGNLYVGGIIDNEHLFVIKVSPEGRLLWASRRSTGFGARRMWVDEVGNVTTWSPGTSIRKGWNPGASTVRRDGNEVASAGGVARFDAEGGLLWNPIAFGRDGAPIVLTARPDESNRLIMGGWSEGTFKRLALDLDTGQWVTPLWQSSEIKGPTQAQVREWSGGVYALDLGTDGPALACFGPDGTRLWRRPLSLPGPLIVTANQGFEVDPEGNAFLALVHSRDGDSESREMTFLRYRAEGTGDPAWSARGSQLTPWGSQWRSLDRAQFFLTPDGGGGLLALVGWQSPPRSDGPPVRELLRFSAAGRLMWRDRPNDEWTARGLAAFATDTDLTEAGQPVALASDGSFIAAFWTSRNEDDLKLMSRGPRQWQSFQGPREVFAADGRWMPGSRWAYGLTVPVQDPAQPAAAALAFNESRWSDLRDLGGGVIALYEAGPTPWPWFIEPTGPGGSDVAYPTATDDGVERVSLDAGEVLVHGRPGAEAVIRAHLPSAPGLRARGSFRFGTRVNPVRAGDPARWPPMFQVRSASQVLADLPLDQWIEGETTGVDFEVPLPDTGDPVDFAIRFARDPKAAPGFVGNGLVPIFPNVAVHVEMLVPKAVPPIRVILPDASSPVAPGSDSTVEVVFGDSDFEADAVECHLDGRWIATVTGPPFRFTLPPLPEGEHSLRVRATEGDLHAWSTPRRLHVGTAGDPARVGAEALRRALAATVAAASLREEEATPEGALNSALVTVIGASLAENPDLPTEIYAELIDEVRAEAAVENAAAGRSLMSLAGHRESGRIDLHDARFAAFKKELNKAFDKISKVGKKLVGRYGLPVKVITTVAQLAGKGCDQNFITHETTCEILRFLGTSEESMGPILKRIEVNQLFALGVMAKLKKSLHTDLTSSRDQLLARMDGLGGDMQQLKKMILRSSQAQGDLQVGMDEMLDQVSGLFGEMNDGFAAQAQATAELQRLTRHTLGILTNQEARRVAEKVLQRKAEDRANEEALDELRERGIKSSIYLLSTIVGQNDPALAKKITAVSSGFFQLKDALKLFNNDQKKATGWATAALSANVVGIGLALVQSMQDTGPTADELILEQLGVIRDMIRDLGEQMHDRFDRVDESLNTIYTDFSLRFDAIDFRLGVIQGQIDGLQRAVDEINAKVDAIQRAQYLLAQENRLFGIDESREQMRRYDPVSNPMSADTFTSLSGRFFSFQLNDARRDTFSPLTGLSTDDAGVVDALGKAGGLPGAVRYLAALAGDRPWPAGRFVTANLSPVAWEMGVHLYLDLVEGWPAHGRSIASVGRDLATMEATAASLRSAFADLSLIETAGGSRANRAFWQAALRNYRQTAETFAAELKEAEREFRRDALDPEGNDDARRAAADRTDLWGAFGQDTGYVPEQLRLNEELIAWDGTAIDGGKLKVPASLIQYLRATGDGLLFFGELLGAGEMRAEYGKAETKEIKEVRSGVFLEEYPFTDPVLILTNTGIRFDSRLGMRLDARLRLSPIPDRANPEDLPVASFTYLHPDFQFHGIRVRWDHHVLFDAWHGALSGFPPLAARAVGVRHLWESPAQLLRTYWDGGMEPDNDGRRDVRSAGGLLIESSGIQNFLDYVGKETAGHLLRFEMNTRIDARLRSLQRQFYGTIPERLGKVGDDVRQAGVRLDGARALIESFVRLAFPESFENDDALRSCFHGNERLPDTGEIARLCALGIKRSANAIDHGDRVDIDAVIRLRFSDLEAAITSRLDEIERAGQAEVLPLIAEVQDRIDRVQALIEATPPEPPAAPPVVHVISASTDHVVLGLEGEPGIAYRFESSSDLLEWNPLPGTVNHGGQTTFDTGGVRAMFFRARVAE